MKPVPSVLVVLALLASGCAGSGSKEEASPSESLPSTSAPAPSPTEDTGNFTPKFHTHDYWGGRSSVLLFEGKLTLGRDPVQETYYDGSALISGIRAFTTKDDGEDSGLTGSKTDVVYQGTSKIELKITWAPDSPPNQKIPGLMFYYKPANSYLDTLLGPVQNGQVYTIDLHTGWADMPHQLAVSRWKFRVEAYDPSLQSYPQKAYIARGDIFVTMTIFNGGERFIDPPHPYFFKEGPARPAGEITATLTNCVVVNNTKAAGASSPAQNPYAYSCPTTYGPVDWMPPAPNIIPWETTKVVVHVYTNYTRNPSLPPAAAPKLGLKFHGADTEDYIFPKAMTTSTANHLIYEIPATEVMTDSPYAVQSDWRFGVYPIIQDQRDLGGEYSGDVHLVITAVNEGSTGRGMGN